MTENLIISICGLVCTECRIYQARHGDKELPNELVDWFENELIEKTEPEQIKCEGCKEPFIVHRSIDGVQIAE